MAPKKAKFTRITKEDGYKLVAANKTAETFMATYGTAELSMSEALRLKIGYDNINWGA